MANAEGAADTDRLRAADLKQLCEVLKGCDLVLSELAKWLEKNDVELTARGLPTAKRGAGYFGNFLGTLMRAYQQTRIEGNLDELRPEIVIKAMSTEAMAKGLLRKAGNAE